jgi:hypothetical protein
MVNRRFWAFVLSLVVLPRLSAATVSFLVVETGLPSGSVQPESSARWEGGVMGVFFDAGHIVFNSPVMRLDQKPSWGSGTIPPELRGEFNDAKTGGADYFVLVLLEYSGGQAAAPEPKAGGSPQDKPRTIQMRLFNTTSGALLYEMSSAGNVSFSSPKEELLDIKNSAQKLIPQLNRKR